MLGLCSCLITTAPGYKARASVSQKSEISSLFPVIFVSLWSMKLGACSQVLTSMLEQLIMNYISPFDFKQCYLGEYLKFQFQEENLAACLQFVTLDFHIIQIAVQFFLLCPLNIKSQYIYFSLNKAQTWRGKFISLPSSDTADSVILIHLNQFIDFFFFWHGSVAL